MNLTEVKLTVAVINRYYTPPIFCAFGILGNILSLLVFSRETKKSSATYLLKMLAITDSLFLLFFFFSRWIALAVERGVVPVSRPDVAHVVLHHVGYLRIWWNLASIWSICLITIDRFVHIYKPLLALRVDMLRYARVGQVVVHLVCLILPIHRCLEYIPGLDPRTGAWGLYPVPGLDRVAHDHQHDILEMLFFWALPQFGVNIPFNLVNISVLRDTRRQMADTGKKAKGDSSTPIMLTVVLLNIIFNVPFMIVSTALIIFNVHWDTLWWLVEMVRTGLILNSSTNFLIYFLVGRAFRTKLRAILCARWTTDHGQTETTKLSTTQ